MEGKLMITIKLTSADLHEVVRILRFKAHEDRDRMIILLNAKPHFIVIAYSARRPAPLFRSQ